MAYGNVTPPALPEYDTAAYPYAVIVFNYEAGAEDWYQVHLYYSGTAFTHNGSCATNAEGVTRKDIYGDGSWTGELTVEAAPELAPGMNGEVYQRIWTNHDILRDDGTVYLAADTVTPISTFDLRSFLTGLTLGLAGKPVLIGGQRTPVAYLYNGVRLPKLPEWDVEAYPYAAMSYADVSAIVPDTFKANLYFMSDPIIFKSVTTGYSGTGSVVKYQIIISENFETALEWADSIGIHENVTETDKWFKCETNEWADIDNFRGTSFEWANFDILKESDNSVYVSASEPVPVYE